MKNRRKPSQRPLVLDPRTSRGETLATRNQTRKFIHAALAEANAGKRRLFRTRK